MHMLDRMLADKHIITVVLQQGWPVGGHDLPGDPCMSPLVPVHACECVCVCVYYSESQLLIHASVVYFCFQVQRDTTT